MQKRAADTFANRMLAEAEELTASDPAVTWLGWFAHPLAAALLLGAAGALGLFLYSQALAILGNLAAQPPWVQWLGYAGLVLCGGAVLYAAVRLLLLYLRLRANRQIRVAGLEELHQRTRLRWLAHGQAAEAKRKLVVRLSPLRPTRTVTRRPASFSYMNMAPGLSATGRRRPPTSRKPMVCRLGTLRSGMASRLPSHAARCASSSAKTSTGWRTSLA